MKLIDLRGRRVLITQAQDFMGPALARVFGNAKMVPAEGRCRAALP